MSDSLRREVVEGGDRWSVEGLVDADSVSTYMLRRCGGTTRELEGANGALRGGGATQELEGGGWSATGWGGDGE